jgi:hypothetical protein
LNHRTRDLRVFSRAAEVYRLVGELAMVAGRRRRQSALTSRSSTGRDPRLLPWERFLINFGEHLLNTFPVNRQEQG